MQRTLLLALALVLLAWPAYAANEGRYPQTLLDAACTDDNATPAAAAVPSIYVQPEAQTGGAADGTCDHDSRILTGPLAADTTFGPFKFTAGNGVLVYIDADDVTLDAGTWAVSLLNIKPDVQAVDLFATQVEQSAEGPVSVSFSPGTAVIGASTHVDTHIPDVFYIQYDERTATAWDGTISWIQY